MKSTPLIQLFFVPIIMIFTSNLCLAQTNSTSIGKPEKTKQAITKSNTVVESNNAEKDNPSETIKKTNPEPQEVMMNVKEPVIEENTLKKEIATTPKN